MILRQVIFCLSIILLFCTNSYGAQETTITIRSDKWCPHNCEMAGRNNGYGVDIAKRIFYPIGYKIDYALMEWNAVLDGLKKGEILAAICSKSAEREEFLVYPQQPIGIYRSSFLVKKESDWKYTGVDSLKQVILGANSGYNYNPELNHYIATNPDRIKNLVGEDTMELQFWMLLNDNIDVLINDEFVLRHALKKYGVEDKFKIVGGISPNPVYLAFSRKRPAAQTFAKIVDQGMQDLRNSGKLRPILHKYGLEDWVKQ